MPPVVPAKAVDEPYVHQPYPTWRYHASKPPVKVHTPAEEAALGPGWEDTPAAFEPGYVKADPDLTQRELADAAKRSDSLEAENASLKAQLAAALASVPKADPGPGPTAAPAAAPAKPKRAKKAKS